MDKSVFEKYIAEMRAMKAVAMPEPKETPAPMPKAIIAEPNAKDMSGAGYLVVNVTSLRGLYPVAGAEVTVFTGENENRRILAKETTDQSGKTPLIKLSAPSAEFSESPNPAERPFAYYNLSVIEDGFRESLSFNLAVFDGVTSVQNVTLEPLSAEPEQNRPIVIDEFESYGL